MDRVDKQPFNIMWARALREGIFDPFLEAFADELCKSVKEEFTDEKIREIVRDVFRKGSDQDEKKMTGEASKGKGEDSSPPMKEERFGGHSFRGGAERRSRGGVNVRNSGPRRSENRGVPANPTYFMVSDEWEDGEEEADYEERRRAYVATNLSKPKYLRRTT